MVRSRYGIQVLPSSAESSPLVEQGLPSTEKVFTNFNRKSLPSVATRVPVEVQVFPFAVIVALLASPSLSNVLPIKVLVGRLNHSRSNPSLVICLPPYEPVSFHFVSRTNPLRINRAVWRPAKLPAGPCGVWC